MIMRVAPPPAIVPAEATPPTAPITAPVATAPDTLAALELFAKHFLEAESAGDAEQQSEERDDRHEREVTLR